ncbi:MAG: hypothetical protein JXN64_05330 [Spirochaetes bacterium]|nr:hypothetical protein [Spirochaetota bacterium]
MNTIPLYDKRTGNKAGQSCCYPQAQTCCIQPDQKDKTMEMPSKQFNKKPSWISDIILTSAGQVPVVVSAWSRSDLLGRIRARIGSFRMHYSIPPGLYAIGKPDANSDVFVSANYKLSFDILRRELEGINGWILVLDTKSINVWCAAGKGTFGTDELVRQIAGTNLAGIVSHRRIIVPQLGAVGVKASEVKNRTGFSVLFGPVEAKDIREYIRLNYKASVKMRMADFSLMKRIELIPVELNPALKKYPFAAIIILLLFGLEPSGIIFRTSWIEGWPFLLLALAGIFTGAFATPVLLSVIPFRSFALKGTITGLIAGIPLVYFTSMFSNDSGMLKAAGIVFITVLSSYLALQFTGATTFTGISGVKKEIKFALPLFIAGLTASLIFIIIHKLNIWGVI